MIICPKCSFEVSYKMRHSIELNACPSCGKVLLNNIEVKRISSIRSKLNKQEFSSKIESSLLSDISFFIYFHIVKPMSLKVADTPANIASPEPSPEQEEADTPDDNDDSNKADDLKSIREEVEREVLMDDGDSILDEDEQESDRISRLKNLAKKQKMSSKNTLRVKRIST